MEDSVIKNLLSVMNTRSQKKHYQLLWNILFIYLFSVYANVYVKSNKNSLRLI